ncbi:MAG: hypothetical protein V2J11_05390 [Desulfofustis sp.]|nr:hypothetical protein [Desulfofustis sp.]
MSAIGMVHRLRQIADQMEYGTVRLIRDYQSCRPSESFLPLWTDASAAGWLRVGKMVLE